MRASILVRAVPSFRYDAFAAGLAACGYSIQERRGSYFAGLAVKDPRPDDVLVVWNRTHLTDRWVRLYQQAGARVIVAENGYLGRKWLGDTWYALALDHHNGAGKWPDSCQGTSPANCQALHSRFRDPDNGVENFRWDSLNVELAPWRKGGRDILILAQRGIGEADVRSPPGWTQGARNIIRARSQRPVRVREHPGERGARISLEDDLAGVWAAVTWGSGAALRAIVAGIPVFHAFPQWIGAPAASPWESDLERPFLGDRLPMLRRLALAQWRLAEIESGMAFRALLESRGKFDGPASKGGGLPPSR